MQTIINTVLSTITGTLIGYLINKIKNLSKEDIRNAAKQEFDTKLKRVQEAENEYKQGNKQKEEMTVPCTVQYLWPTEWLVIKKDLLSFQAE